MTIWVRACVHMSEREPGSNSWVIGNGWDSLDWGGPLPTKDWIPQACSQKYLYLLWKEGHMALINDLAGEMTGLDTAKTAH